jgi:lysyl-tRNA synthetase class 2
MLSGEGGVEVVTPILCPYPDIAPVPQFVTTHPGSGALACLRIAPTEYLKQLLVAGAKSVFEFSTNFRSETVDSTHMPEFTSLEVMVCGASVRDMEEVTERLCRVGLRAVSPPSLRDGYTPPRAKRAYRLEQEWYKVSLRRVLHARYGFPPDHLFKHERVVELYSKIVGGLPPASLPEAVDGIVEAVAESFDAPVFIGEYPDYLGGPAKPCDDDPRFKERTELFIGKMELANMSSTLTDPTLLRAWHERGLRAKEELGIQPNALDKPLIEAISQGLAPSAVLGLGIERLLLLATNLDDIALTRAFPYSQLFYNGGVCK